MKLDALPDGRIERPFFSRGLLVPVLGFFLQPDRATVIAFLLALLSHRGFQLGFQGGRLEQRLHALQPGIALDRDM